MNPYSSSSAETIERVFPQADIVRLYRSYRSTMEITAFAQRITPNPNIIPLERHGPEPVVARFGSPTKELQAITSGANNTAIGYQALGPNNTGASNTAIGYQALFANRRSTG